MINLPVGTIIQYRDYEDMHKTTITPVLPNGAVYVLDHHGEIKRFFVKLDDVYSVVGQRELTDEERITGAEILYCLYKAACVQEMMRDQFYSWGLTSYHYDYV